MTHQPPSDTPVTDAEERLVCEMHDDYGSYKKVVESEKVRKIERELAQARAEIERLLRVIVRYAIHDDRCPNKDNYHNKCTCGLAEQLK